MLEFETAVDRHENIKAILCERDNVIVRQSASHTRRL
jgi:hypothetical protein